MNILLILFLFPVFVNAQKGEFVNYQVGVDFPKDYTYGLSLRLSGGINFGNNLKFGAGTGITKFENVPGVYLPLFAIVQLYPLNNGKIYPVVSVQPGYGFYSKTQSGQNNIETRGGFTFFGGGGIGFAAASFMIGYSVFSKTYEITRFTGVSIRAGVTMF